MRTFKIWLEEKLMKRRIAANLLTALGFKRDTLEKNININLDIIPEEKLRNAIESLGITPKAKEKLLDSISNHQYQSLNDLLKQIEDEDIEQQDTSTSQPAVLPSSNQQMPKPQQKQPMQQPMNPGM